MYARRVNGRTLTFGVSGALWQRSLVMYDDETHSLWSHLLGEAMAGELKGTRLLQIPSVMTTWRAWRTEHPETQVLSLPRTSRQFLKRMYRRPHNVVIGIVHEGKATAWTFGALMESPVRNVDLQGTPVVVAFDPMSFTARLFSREVDGTTLEFDRRDGQLVDRQTMSVWRLASGRAVEGPQKDETLTPLPAIMSFRKAWRDFHPRTRMIRASSRIPGTRSSTPLPAK